MSYSPLDESKDEIRLITLLPRSRGSRAVECTLKTVSLASLSPAYRDFLSTPDILSTSKRKSFVEWARSRCDPDLGRPPKGHSQNRGPPENCHRFTWGDYAALSYVWGDTNKVSTILVNGEKMKVTRNLHTVLRAFCAAEEFAHGFKLWVDAICINQLDTEERGRQVRRMQEIYETAWTVIAWLGEKSEESDKAIELIQTLADFSRDDRGKELETRLQKQPDYLGSGGWLALDRLMSRPYWYRLWILQELIMGGSAVLIRCGTSSVDWGSFCAGIALLQDYLWIIKDGLLSRDRIAKGLVADQAWETTSLHLVHQDLSVLSRSDEVGQNAFDLGRLLGFANSAECQDPSDMVYGLVGLMEADIAKQLVPDYSLRPSKIYATTAKMFIQYYNNLEPIREGNPWGPNEGPSWVADWQWEGRARWARIEEHHFWGPSWLLPKTSSKDTAPLPYQASGNSSCNAMFSDDDLMLTCGGFLIDGVSGLSARGDGYFSWSKDSIVQPGRWTSIYGDTSHTSEALYRTLVADRVVNGGRADARHSAILSLPSTFAVAYPQFKNLGWGWLSAQEEYYFRWEEWRNANRDFQLGDRKLNDYFSDEIRNDASEYDFTEVYSCFDRVSQRRRFMTTKKGYMGWVPDNVYGSRYAQTRRGDLIAILFGCNTPIVIRPHHQHFQVIGEAYVQGLMDGKAMAFLKTGQAEEQTFTFI